MKTARLNIIIPLTRVGNINKVMDSIYESPGYYRVIRHDFELRTMVIMDTSVPIIGYMAMFKHRYPDMFLVFRPDVNVAGHASRNASIKVINSLADENSGLIEYFYSLDDDNILHPDFLSRFADWANEDNLKQMYIFSQLNKDGTLRLLADINSVKVGHIDTAMFVFDIKHAVDNNIYFDETDYCADGKFAETYRNSLKLDQIGVTQERLCYYNFLR